MKKYLQNKRKECDAMKKLFNFKKKNTPQQNIPNETLTKEGDLPFGWIYRNREFVSKVENEYSYFLNNWIDSRTKSQKEQYAALKSFVLYLEDAEKLCKSKGECFEVWFYVLIASKEYIEKRKSELDDLTKNFDQIETTYKIKQQEMNELDKKVIDALKKNDGILQSEFVKLFDPIVKNEVASLLYSLDKEGIIQRTKSGRSYILHFKE